MQQGSLIYRPPFLDSFWATSNSRAVSSYQLNAKLKHQARACLRWPRFTGFRTGDWALTTPTGRMIPFSASTV